MWEPARELLPLWILPIWGTTGYPGPALNLLSDRRFMNLTLAHASSQVRHLVSCPINHNILACSPAFTTFIFPLLQPRSFKSHTWSPWTLHKTFHGLLMPRQGTPHTSHTSTRKFTLILAHIYHPITHTDTSYTYIHQYTQTQNHHI